jgi:hypothetical protein
MVSCEEGNASPNCEFLDSLNVGFLGMAVLRDLHDWAVWVRNVVPYRLEAYVTSVCLESRFAFI